MRDCCPEPSIMQSIILEPARMDERKYDMKKTSNRRSKMPSPPRTRAEAALRIGRYMRWLYGDDTPPATLAAPLIDAAFDEIAAVEDGAARKQLLREAMERAYAELGGT